jgi:hypothetical protein
MKHKLANFYTNQLSVLSCISLKIFFFNKFKIQNSVFIIVLVHKDVDKVD